MSDLEYTVEFDGMYYVVLKRGKVLAAFSHAEEAYAARRSFATKNLPHDWQKVPPAIRFAKETFYGQASYH